LRELARTIDEELGDPLAGTSTNLLEKIAKKLEKAFPRITKNCKRTGSEMFVDKDCNAESSTFKCPKPGCGHTFQSCYA